MPSSLTAPHLYIEKDPDSGELENDRLFLTTCWQEGTKYRALVTRLKAIEGPIVKRVEEIAHDEQNRHIEFLARKVFKKDKKRLTEWFSVVSGPNFVQLIKRDLIGTGYPIIREGGLKLKHIIPLTSDLYNKLKNKLSQFKKVETNSTWQEPTPPWRSEAVDRFESRANATAVKKAIKRTAMIQQMNEVRSNEPSLPLFEGKFLSTDAAFMFISKEIAREAKHPRRANLRVLENLLRLVERIHSESLKKLEYLKFGSIDGHCPSVIIKIKDQVKEQAFNVKQIKELRRKLVEKLLVETLGLTLGEATALVDFHRIKGALVTALMKHVSVEVTTERVHSPRYSRKYDEFYPGEETEVEIIGWEEFLAELEKATEKFGPSSDVAFITRCLEEGIYDVIKNGMYREGHESYQGPVEPRDPEAPLPKASWSIWTFRNRAKAEKVINAGFAACEELMRKKSKKDYGISEMTTAAGIGPMETPVGVPPLKRDLGPEKEQEKEQGQTDWEEEFKAIYNMGYLFHPLILPKDCQHPFIPISQPELKDFLKRAWNLAEELKDFSNSLISEQLLELEPDFVVEVKNWILQKLVSFAYHKSFFIYDRKLHPNVREIPKELVSKAFDKIKVDLGLKGDLISEPLKQSFELELPYVFTRKYSPQAKYLSFKDTEFKVYLKLTLDMPWFNESRVSVTFTGDRQDKVKPRKVPTFLITIPGGQVPSFFGFHADLDFKGEGPEKRSASLQTEITGLLDTVFKRLEPLLTATIHRAEISKRGELAGKKPGPFQEALRFLVDEMTSFFTRVGAQVFDSPTHFKNWAIHFVEKRLTSPKRFVRFALVRKEKDPEDFYGKLRTELIHRNLIKVKGA